MNEPERDKDGGSRIKSGMARKAPRWTVAFLRALERTGDARAAAGDAGIDHSTAYARRKAHAEFAAAWEEALRTHAQRVKAKEAEEVAAISEAPPPASLVPLPTGFAGREELVGAGSQMKRAGPGRWSQAKEKIFFDELAATANVSRAAAAAGVSANAVYARRLRHPLFKAKWEAVLEAGRAAIEMHLVESARKSFAPEEIDTGEVEPKVSIAEAIKIAQLHGSKKPQEELRSPFAEQAAAMGEEEIEALRERILNKLKRVRQRDMPEMLAKGWTLDEEYDRMIPPGWVRGGR